jgi:hypothetical protein
MRLETRPGPGRVRRRFIPDPGVQQQLPNRSTVSNLSVPSRTAPSTRHCFSTGSNTGIPDSISFCCSAIVTA